MNKIMNKIIDYCMISAPSVKKLNQEAAEMIKHGWQPIGGGSCSIAYHPSKTQSRGTSYERSDLYSQAFVKYEVSPF